MRLVRATDEFVLNGTSYSGFPILLNSSMEVVWESFQFLIYYCISRGRVRSKNSWWKFGQDLYDYLGYLEAKELSWRAHVDNSAQAPLVAYRNWCLSQLQTPKTINGRLRTIIKFYQYAERQGWIKSLPYGIESIPVRRASHFFSHLDKSPKTGASPDVMLREHGTPLAILTEQQLAKLIHDSTQGSHNLIFRMALQTGLRKQEILTFPASYISEARLKTNNSVVRVRLNPTDMLTKGSRSRDIDIPVNLFTDLLQYKAFERYQLIAKNGTPEPRELFVNANGNPYSIRGSILNKTIKKLVGRSDIGMHTLRHTFATFKLYDLRANPKYKGEPLVYVQDRLGHTSINTTRQYLHYVETLEGDLMHDYDNNIDRLSTSESAPNV